MLIQLIQTGSIDPKARLKPATPNHVPSADHIRPILRPGVSTGSKVRIAIGSSKKVYVNPKANWFNRPASAVTPRDDYLGRRAHVDTVANLTQLVERCRGTLEGLETMRNVFDCLVYMDEKESEYYYLPDAGRGERASEADPRVAEYNNADGRKNSQRQYDTVSHATPASESSKGTCPGPVIPYHVYWTGPATWRVEIFIKSYLYTQNLPCSQLWIWLDSDRNPDAVNQMLHHDALFERFLPFVERGDLVITSWKFPARIPLPKNTDNTDGVGYYSSPGRPNALGESVVADGVVRDSTGQEWLALTPKQMTFLPQAVSDAVRFVVLHLHGGIYLDMDVLMLRDMRPLLLPDPKTGQHSFAERWAAHSHPGDYNTAIMSLTANSSLSSYLLRGGVRMGLNFHPRVIGRMAWKDGRNQELLMLETAAFDPIWTEFNWAREGRCTVPCLRDYGVAFKGKPEAIRDEWESYDGPQMTRIDLKRRDSSLVDSPHVKNHVQKRNTRRHAATQSPSPPASHAEDQDSEDEQQIESFSTTHGEEEKLRAAGVIADYDIAEDKYPPNNRTLENFFRGAWTYHIHNQWIKHPEPSSWFDVIEQAQDGFFDGSRTNPYGEHWHGPPLQRYNRWPEYT
ncbi:MAG: hypothetical protein M1814_003842 [Vezdaea aestivalis]|nr:MAG: hypothetical protein M1814_003842 [Vezdaea aestivalis]